MKNDAFYYEIQEEIVVDLGRDKDLLYHDTAIVERKEFSNRTDMLKAVIIDMAEYINTHKDEIEFIQEYDDGFDIHIKTEKENEWLSRFYTYY